MASTAYGDPTTASHLSPQRIVVLDAGHAQIVDALGAGNRLVLAPQDPSLDGIVPPPRRYHHQPSIEGILAARPDLMIAGNPVRDAVLLSQAQRLDIPAVMIERHHPAIQRIERLATLIGRPGEGEALRLAIEADYARASDLIEQSAKERVLHVSSSGAGASGVITGAGASTSADALIRRAGGINTGAQAGMERYQSLSAEGVMAMAPQVVLVSHLELPQLGGKAGIWDSVPGLRHTPAASTQRLVVLDHAAVKFDAADSGRATLTLARELYTP